MKATQKALSLIGSGFNPRVISAPVPSQKLLLDILKRQARRIMESVSAAAPAAIAGHLAALDQWREVVGHLFRHDLADSPEARLSGRQLIYPSTLADFFACLEITRKEHRAPQTLNVHDSQLSEIIRRLDMLAGFIATNAQAEEFLGSNNQPKEENE